TYGGGSARMVVPYYPTDKQRAAREMRGWYRIAEVKKSGYFDKILCLCQIFSVFLHFGIL
ncbi:MAG: hypothetical protein IIW46_00685, partial [Bacteroidaceae bacterium]|nr:hypothetical protein [Bacteroidaceae bacterium]